MILDILIPTYNRAEFLLKNLEVLAEIVDKGNYNEQIRLIISENCSPDDTFAQVSAFQEKSKLQIVLYRQKENIGLKANALFVLEKATAEYVMYLGDDDYISYEYLSEAMNILKNDHRTTYIVPNYVPVTVDDVIADDARDPIAPTRKFEPGEKAMLRTVWKAHQMSGLIFKRDNLHAQYVERKVDNIYPYVFFAGVSVPKGTTYQISQFPVRVVQPVKKKDWGYGEDGLVNDLFDNFKKLDISPALRFKLELTLMYFQPWRLTMYSSKGQKAFWKAARKIGFADNASFLFSLFYPFILILIKVKRKIEA